jgi:UDP-N-acetylmuramate: L-alanyl-gamma-D-glutamyl-meso-diaminopimelate ligase
MKIHILGIVGTMTAPLAIELKRLGHEVSGSDQEKIYPPYSQLLKKAKIPVNQVLINSQLDLCIVGSSYKSFSQTKQEYQQILSQKIPFISATKYIAQNIGKKNTILVAGSYGKTTITGLLVWIFNQANLNPSYMFGGTSLNRLPSLKTSSSEWSIIEADESINGLDKQAKFLIYPVKYLLLTSANWEHKESYQTEADNLLAFQKLIQRVPKNGFIVYNPQVNNLCRLITFAKCPVIPYNLDLKFKTRLLGSYNKDNVTAAYTLCQKLGLSDQLIKKGIQGYKGISRRLQLLKVSHDIHFYDDFSQSINRLKPTIDSLQKLYPQNPIKVFYEPHASFTQHPDFVTELKNAFQNSIEVVLSQINFSLNYTNKTTAKDFKNAIGSKLLYLPLSKDIYNHYITTLEPQDIVVHFSSGGLEGLKTYKKIINYFSNH